MGERWAHFDEDLITCPWCGHRYSDSEERFTNKGKPSHGKCPCEHCSGMFYWQTKWHQDYGRIAYDTATWHFINYEVYTMSEKSSSLTLHIERVDNGFILKDITGKKKGKRPPTQVSTNVAGLKAHIAQTIHENLLGVTHPVAKDGADCEKKCPSFTNVDQRNTVFGPVTPHAG